MAGHSQRPLGQQARRLLTHKPFVCCSCRFQAQQARLGSRNHSSASQVQQRRRDASREQQASQQSQKHVSYVRPQRRHAGSLASSSAINAPSTVPSSYQDLHEKLSKLRQDAAGYVDLSKLQLAIRGLETRRATTRVAFLGLDQSAAQSARRLARALLSDPLGDEEAWEQELLQSSPDRSVLLRYGEMGELPDGNTFTQTIVVPSKYLQDNHLEIMISPLQTGPDTPGDFLQAQEEDLLVPAIPIAAPHGRLSFVRSPVHKAVVIGSGITGAVELGRLRLPREHANIHCVLDQPLTDISTDPDVQAVDTRAALKALEQFRKDDTTGGSFGQAWLDSSVPTVADLLRSHQADVGVRYAASLLRSTAQALVVQEEKLVSQEDDQALPNAVREELQSAITTWSAQAHRDLRDNLIVAFQSPTWRRTTWWKLLWRIDDVTYSSSDILNNCWLNETEQSLAFLSGRIRQAGLATEDDLKEEAYTDKEAAELLQHAVAKREAGKPSKKPTVSELLQVPTTLSRIQQQSGINPLFDPPWPHTIALARQTMLHVDVPAMHRKAQALLLTTCSTVGGSAALGGWLWVASAGSALYESGAIFALGLVWGLRRLQRRWGKERDTFADTTHENGRKVLVEIETHLRKLVRDGGRTKIYQEDMQQLEKAKAAVAECQEVLEEAKLESKAE